MNLSPILTRCAAGAALVLTTVFLLASPVLAVPGQKTTAPVPEPTAVLVFAVGAAVAGIAIHRRSRKRGEE